MVEDRTTLRLFAAVNLPDAVRRQLAAAQSLLAGEGWPIRWVRPEGIHVTLAFLGSTPSTLRPKIERAVAEAAAGSGPLRLEVIGLGCFPSASRPRVLWAGLRGDLQALGGLQRDLARRLRRVGVQLEDRAFSPHATLGRARAPLDAGQGRRLGEMLAARREEHFGAWTAEAIELMHSDIQPGGSVYTTLFSAPLGATPHPPH